MKEAEVQALLTAFIDDPSYLQLNQLHLFAWGKIEYEIKDDILTLYGEKAHVEALE